MRPWVLILALLALIRLPFLNQPVQGDDVYYLAGAQHAQIDPLHPSHARYVFQGQIVDMRGHPHPPFNAWFLAAVLAVAGDVREVPFHAAYLVFSLLAAWGAVGLARRFSARPLFSVLLILTTPAFLINGNSLESDLPLFAFWLAGFALYVRAVDTGSLARLAGSFAVLLLAGLTAYQAAAMTPILGFYLWRNRLTWIPAWIAAAAPLLAMGSYQLWERYSGGEFPAAVLAGYFTAYGLQSVQNKLLNAAALSVHLCWLIFPALTWAAFQRRNAEATGPQRAVPALNAHGREPASSPERTPFCVRELLKSDTRFLLVWLAGFFTFALAVFFAGSMRYLLPAAAPLAILVTNSLADKPRWLALGFVAQLTLGLALATANYDHWAGYRDFVASLKDEMKDRRVWVNAELGMRFYAESEGALPLEQGQAVRPGDLILSSRLAFPVSFTTGGGALAMVRQATIHTRVPFQLIGLHSWSGYSSAARGLLPFSITAEPVDLVTAQSVVERAPALEYLTMHSPHAEHQIVSGVYQLEAGAWRWASPRAVLLLKGPATPVPLEAQVRIPDSSPAKKLELWLDGTLIAAESIPGPGPMTIRSGPVLPAARAASVAITVDQGFRAAGDQRQLGFILSAAGFR
jgi:hypothetical protein